MTDRVELSTVLAAHPERVYDAWLDAEEHAEMTGAAASSEPEVGGRFTAGDGYIAGRYLELERPHRLVLAWRTAEFPERAPDSRVEIFLEAEGEGTRLHILHTEIPPGQGERYETGWEEHYFQPMRGHFGK